MKTKDAFAFRGFDSERILQRPYFRQWREKYHVGTNLTDAEILANIFDATHDLPMLELENALLTEILYGLEDLHRLIQRHANAMDGRLEKYRRAVTNATDVFFLQAKMKREEEMARIYMIDVVRAIGVFMANVKNRWQASEQKLQAVYRRKFGERLRTARERAGLSRKDFAVDCHITPNALHYYENGQREPSLTSLKRFARKLKTSTDSLLE